MIEREFVTIIRDIVKSEPFVGMKHYRHHVRSNIYRHSVRVAYLCYSHHKRFGTRTDLAELVRGALLHDYYLYDWHDRARGTRLHLFTHQRRALANAGAHYPELTERQRDMIGRHMFPVVPLPPRTRAGWIVCFYDKVAALQDYFGKNVWKQMQGT